jgi:hypothetical protein
MFGVVTAFSIFLGIMPKRSYICNYLTKTEITLVLPSLHKLIWSSYDIVEGRYVKGAVVERFTVTELHEIHSDLLMHVQY